MVVLGRVPACVAVRDASQQPILPQVMHMRRCTQRLPIFRHSSQPAIDEGSVVTAIRSRWVQIGCSIASASCRSEALGPDPPRFVAERDERLGRGLDESRRTADVDERSADGGHATSSSSSLSIRRA